MNIWERRYVEDWRYYSCNFDMPLLGLTTEGQFVQVPKIQDMVWIDLSWKMLLSLI